MWFITRVSNEMHPENFVLLLGKSVDRSTVQSTQQDHMTLPWVAGEADVLMVYFFALSEEIAHSTVYHHLSQISVLDGTWVNRCITASSGDIQSSEQKPRLSQLR